MAIASSYRALLFYQVFELKHTITISEDSPINLLSSFNHVLIATPENFRIVLIQHILVPNDLSRIFQQGPSVSYDLNHPIVSTSFSTEENFPFFFFLNKHLDKPPDFLWKQKSLRNFSLFSFFMSLLGDKIEWEDHLLNENNHPVGVFPLTIYDFLYLTIIISHFSKIFFSISAKKVFSIYDD